MHKQEELGQISDTTGERDQNTQGTCVHRDRSHHFS